MLRRASAYYKQMRYVRNVPKRKGVTKNVTSNPGVENRLEILRMETPNFDNMEEVDADIEDLESDFAHVGEFHREFEREKIRATEKLSFVITKDRFFKQPKLPNLLTWGEKEQIKYLNQLDPQEWDVECLSKCFPATPDVIKKILKSKWKPKDSNTLKRHDKAVERNWILLKEGKLSLEDEQRHHFLNFSSRKSTSVLSETHQKNSIIIINKTHKSEFADLLSKNVRKDNENSMEKSIEVEIPELLSRKVSPEQKSESFVLPGERKAERRPMSFTEFKKSVESDLESREKRASLNESPENQQDSRGQLYVEENEASNDIIRTKEKAANELVKYKKEVVEGNLTKQQLDVYLKAENYERKIKIPEGRKDHNAVYKVNDCFYDWDGTFLYRVPGMK